MSWRRLSAGLRNYADSSVSDTGRAELLPLIAQEERQLDAWEDDGGMVAASSKPVATLDLPEQVQSLP